MSELQGLQSRITAFRNAGVEVVAVSVDSVERNLKVAEKLGLDFPLLSDSTRRVITAWGVAHEGAGIDGSAVARPALFLIDSDGFVVWRELTENWRVRARPEHLLEVITTPR